MLEDVIDWLVCAVCGSPGLSRKAFRRGTQQQILDGVVWCEHCHYWYAIEDELLEFLGPELAYRADRAQCWRAHAGELSSLGLTADVVPSTRETELQRKQQRHFDWYAANETQTYTDYAKTPFWTASDNLVLEQWHRQIQPGKALLEIGCAQGRSTFRFMDLDITIVACDISKNMIRQAIQRYRSASANARATFFVADANTFPFKERVFDYVLIYGVLHHLPNPERTCQEIARVLKLGGIYFGQENNRSAFRFVFDWMMKVFPLWHEEAGAEAMISRQMIAKSFEGTGVQPETKTSVFLPPHFVNLLSHRLAYHSLKISDRIAGVLPFLRDNGGILVIRAEKSPYR